MTWYPDGTGVQPDGDVGGDRQATDVLSIRYHHTDHPGAVVTVYAYGIGHRDGYAVEVQIERLLCGDRSRPGDTEQWSGETYQTLPGTHPASGQALQAARAYLERHEGRDITWDGVQTR
jgi:hypothetical protein